MPNKTPLFKLDGAAVLGSSVAEWRLTSGTRPFMAEFDLIPEDAENRLTGNLRAVTLEMSLDPDDPEASTKFENLYILHEVAGDNPHIRRVKVADRRWFWNHKFVRRSFNKRRRVGVKRLLNPGGRETDQVIDRLWYAPYSVKPNGTPYSAMEVLNDLLLQAGIPESEVGGSTFPFEYEDGLRSNLEAKKGDPNEIPIEDLELADQAGDCIQRVLSFIPSADIFVRANGSVLVYAKGSGFERGLVDELGAPTVGGGFPKRVDLSRIRPNEIHVYFQREVEVRFDAQELDRPTFGPDQRFMDNVLPSPDYQADVNGSVVAQGTWITFPQAFSAWGKHPAKGNFSFTLLRKAATPFIDLWTICRHTGETDPDNDWASRIGACQRNYRRTFRINRRWMDRIAQLMPFRIGITDPSTGTRPPASVWANHCVLGGQRFLYAQAGGGADLSYAVNVQSIAGKGSAPDITEKDRHAPAKLTVLDHDQGVISVEYAADPSRVWSQVLPGWLTDPSGGGDQGDNVKPKLAGPSGDILSQSRAVTMDSVTMNNTLQTTLTGNHRTRVVLTAIPAPTPPFGQRRRDSGLESLERVIVRPNDVREMLPAAARSSRNNGPIMEVFVGPQIEGARAMIAWADKDRDAIEAMFGVGGGGGGILNSGAAPSYTVVNLSETIGGAGSLTTIARAQAASIWGAMPNRFQGRKVVPFKGNAEPAGWLREVTHRISTDGKLETFIALPDEIEQMNFFSLMPASVRNALLKRPTSQKV